MLAPEGDGLRWRKSSRSAANGACVEIAETSDSIAVRDSKDPQGPHLRFGVAAWQTFISSVRAGAFDRP
ncbi:MAG: DUF397 domain-containing protein [Actinobacteria bacterium]|nr:MAG: DUF397 domain-containing protein [Actinomycetota bacterium]